MGVVLCFGDSNTHGSTPMPAPGVSGRHAFDDRWPNVLGRHLGPAHQVISEGLPGRTTVHDDPIEGGCRSGALALPIVLHSHRPIDLLIVMLGTNDLKPRFSVTAWEIARSVERLITMARAEGVTRHEMIIAPPSLRDDGSLGVVFPDVIARQQGLNTYLSQSAARLGCAFVDAGAHLTVSAVDGVHWEPAGHHALGAAVAPIARKLLEDGY